MEKGNPLFQETVLQHLSTLRIYMTDLLCSKTKPEYLTLM